MWRVHCRYFFACRLTCWCHKSVWTSCYVSHTLSYETTIFSALLWESSGLIYRHTVIATLMLTSLFFLSDWLIFHDLSEENGEPPNQLSNETQTSIAVTPAPELLDRNVETTKDAQSVPSSSKKYRLWLLRPSLHSLHFIETRIWKVRSLICCIFWALKDLALFRPLLC